MIINIYVLLKKHSINFLTNLLILKNLKKNNYNLILVIVDKITQIIHHKPEQTIIKIAKIVKVIINVVLRYHKFVKSILCNKSTLFMLIFWLSLS